MTSTGRVVLVCVCAQPPQAAQQSKLVGDPVAGDDLANHEAGCRSVFRYDASDESAMAGDRIEPKVVVGVGNLLHLRATLRCTSFGR